MSFSSGNSGGASTISGLSDVTLNNPATNQALLYDATSSKWKNLPIPGGGSSPFISVTSYGASGDGVTDDTAAIQSAVTAAAGTPVFLPVGRYLVELSFTDEDIHLFGPGVLVQKQASTALKIMRTIGSPISVTQGTVQFGPNLPNSSIIFTQTYTTLSLNSGSYAAFKAGDVYHLSSQDSYPWAIDATNAPNVWQAEFVPILGIGMNISSLSNSSSFEGLSITGATSGATGVVDSSTAIDASNGKVLLQSCSKNFISGETLNVSGLGAVGTAGAMYLVMAGRTLATYSTGPQIRKFDTTKKCVLDITIDADGDVNAFVGSAQRGVGVSLSGVYRPIANIVVKSSWSRAVIVESCYLGDIDAKIDGLPDHAQPEEGAYGYGVEIRGCSQGIRVKVLGRNLRHAFTTNPNGATYGLRPFQWGISKYITVHDSVGIGCLAAAFDTHDGCEFTLFDNCRASSPASGNRWLTNGIGFNNRGFGTTFRNCLAEGAKTGFSEGGVAILSYFPYTNRYENCTAVGFQDSGFSQGTNADSNGRVELIRCNMRGDGLPTNTPYYQVAYSLSGGQTDIHDCIASNFNGTPIQIKNANKININGFYADYSDGTGSSGLRVNATQTELNIIDYKVRAGASTPASLLRNNGGNTVWNIDGVRCVNRVTPPALFTVDAGTPSWNIQELLGAVRPSTANGDVSLTLTAHTSEPTQLWTAPLTANRSVTLSTNSAVNGDTFRIVRTASATGTSTLTVAGKPLAAAQWADVQFDGTAWQIVASGSL